MADKLTMHQGYALADILAMPVHYDAKRDRLTGDAVKLVSLGDLDVKFRPRIVDSRVMIERCDALVNIKGNLYVLVTVSMRRSRVYVINAAKFDGAIEEELLERSMFAHNDIMKRLGASAVRVYEQQNIGADKTWIELGSAKGA